MTPARKAALQWFHDNPMTGGASLESPAEVSGARLDGEIEWVTIPAIAGHYTSGHILTDLGRRRLNGDEG